MRSDLSMPLWNTEKFYESLVNYGKRQVYLSDSLKREFWSAAQAFFEKMAYDKHTLELAPDGDKFIDFLKSCGNFFTDQKILDNCEKLLNILTQRSWLRSLLSAK